MQGLVAYDSCGYWVYGKLTSGSVATNDTSVLSFPSCKKFSALGREQKFLNSVAVAQSRTTDIWACAAVFLETAEVFPENPLFRTTEQTFNKVEQLAVSEGTAIVRVKFLLKKECRFGERFDVVGSDPAFGNWDPKAGVPMKWSEGHNWSAEMDIPNGKKFEYKFVLIRVNGEIEWQPGSNHYLDTTDSISPLVVCKPWSLEEAESGEEKSVAIVEQDTKNTVTEEEASSFFDMGMDTLILEEDQLRRAEILEAQTQADDVYGKAPLSHSSVENVAQADTEFPLQAPTLVPTLVEVPDEIADNTQLLA